MIFDPTRGVTRTGRTHTPHPHTVLAQADSTTRNAVQTVVNDEDETYSKYCSTQREATSVNKPQTDRKTNRNNTDDGACENAARPFLRLLSRRRSRRREAEGDAHGWLNRAIP